MLRHPQRPVPELLKEGLIELARERGGLALSWAR
jgi:hypothetical protein